MLMLSQLLNYTLVDSKGNQARLSDLTIELDGDIYPPIHDLLWQKFGDDPLRLPWQAVQEISSRQRVIRVNSLAQGESVDAEWLGRAVLLRRDILDALMLNLIDRTTSLANDICLQEEDGKLRLTSIDTSFWAILRRLSNGILANHRYILRDWKSMEFLRGNSQRALEGLSYHGLVNRLPSGEIAYLADQLPYPYAAELVCLLPDLKAADTLESMIPDLTSEVFEELSQDKAGSILALMRPDIAADLIGKMDLEEAKCWLEKLPPERSDLITRLMRYPDDTAGGIMTSEFIALPTGLKVGQAIAKLREELHKPNPVDFISIIYVIGQDDQERLSGAITLRDLLVAENDQMVEKIMNPFLIVIHPLDKSHDSAGRVIESGLAALPVVNPDGKILGVITIDTALALTAPKGEKREVLRLYT